MPTDRNRKGTELHYRAYTLHVTGKRDLKILGASVPLDCRTGTTREPHWKVYPSEAHRAELSVMFVCLLFINFQTGLCNRRGLHSSQRLFL